MCFSVITVLLAALLFNITQACLRVQGSATQDQTVTVNVYDNDKWVCTWHGKYTSGEYIYMICTFGVHTAIRITNRPASIGRSFVNMMYGSGGRFWSFQPVPSTSLCPDGGDCYLESFRGQYLGCPATGANAGQPERGVEPTEPVGKLGDVVGTVGWIPGTQVSTEGLVTATGGITAGVARSTVF